MSDGHLEPDFPINKISVKGTFRHDLRNLDPLVESMSQLGLLTPIVVTSDGLLICGKRRLAAAQRLGWPTVPAWIPERVSAKLRLIALHDDEVLHEPLTPIEQAEMFAEYEKLYAEQARLRQEASRFGASRAPGAADSAGPQLPARAQAALAVTGSQSYERLEQIRELQRIAASDNENPWVREDATEALMAINEDGKVYPRWAYVKLQQAYSALEDGATDPELPDGTRLAAVQAAQSAKSQARVQDALREAKRGVAEVQRQRAAIPTPPPDPLAGQKRQVRLLVDLVRREHGWWDRNDPVVFGQIADEAQWEMIASLVAGASAFLDCAAAARDDAACGLVS